MAGEERRIRNSNRAASLERSTSAASCRETDARIPRLAGTTAHNTEAEPFDRPPWNLHNSEASALRKCIAVTQITICYHASKSRSPLCDNHHGHGYNSGINVAFYWRAKMDPILIREWSNENFHERVVDLESRGYIAQRETYTVTAEVNPETGYVIHVYCMEMRPAIANLASKAS
jgi:hypothetical protein